MKVGFFNIFFGKYKLKFIKLLSFLILFVALFFSKNTLAQSYADAVEKSIGSVVMVFTQEYANLSTFITYNPKTNKLERITKKSYLQASGLGSGIVLNDEGYIITNYHVIKGADQIFAKVNEGESEFPVEIVGYDSESDIALLKAKFENSNASPLKPITIANSDDLRVGDGVLAIGNPFGVGKTVTQGIVSALNRNNLGINTFEDFIQVDAAINRGNSGGALLNLNGDLIGINSAIYSDDGSFSGLAFAIPSKMLLEIVNQLKQYGQVIRGWIGIQIAELEEAVSKGLNIDHGVVITTILENSPADRGGLMIGDVVTRVDGKIVKNSRDIVNYISQVKPGTEAVLDIVRRNNPLKLTINIRQRPNFTR